MGTSSNRIIGSSRHFDTFADFVAFMRAPSNYKWNPETKILTLMWKVCAANYTADRSIPIEFDEDDLDQRKAM